MSAPASPSLDAVLRGSLTPLAPATSDPIRAAATDGAAQTDLASPAYRAKLTQAAEKFEGFFVNQILQQMRKSMRDIDPDEATNSKHGEDDMVDMSDTLLAESLSQRHAFGVADALLRQLLPNRQPGQTSAVDRPATLPLRTGRPRSP
jgi:flagellar protein FlgJ